MELDKFLSKFFLPYTPPCLWVLSFEVSDLDHSNQVFQMIDTYVHEHVCLCFFSTIYENRPLIRKFTLTLCNLQLSSPNNKKSHPLQTQFNIFIILLSFLFKCQLTGKHLRKAQRKQVCYPSQKTKTKKLYISNHVVT